MPKQIVTEEEVIEDFHKKTEMIRHSPLDFEEIEVEDFVRIIFERDWKTLRDVQPFEEIQSDEYRDWKSQSQAGADPIDYSGYGMWRYNPIIFWRDYSKTKDGEEGRNKHRIILKDDDETLDWVRGKKFALMSPVTYVGRNNTVSNARYMYGFVIDLDGVGLDEMRHLLNHFRYQNRMPAPNILVNSGHGMHVYYLLQRPVPLYGNATKLLKKLKYYLTDIVWNNDTSNLDKRQYQGVLQAFRMPGTLTKFGEPIRAFYCRQAPMYTIAQLNGWNERDKIKALTGDEVRQLDSGRPAYNPTSVTLQKAKELWPEWYASKVIRKEPVGRKWHVKRDLYDWWLNMLKGDPGRAEVHHRYWCILTLVIFAVKCDISRNEVLRDAIGLVPLLDQNTDSEDNHFTAGDVIDAMKAYDARYSHWPTSTIDRTTNIRIMPNRRNGRKQYIHLARARALQIFDDPDGFWRKGNGRRHATVENSKEAARIREWMEQQPGNSNKSACARDLGLSRTTVTKWWNLLNS